MTERETQTRVGAESRTSPTSKLSDVDERFWVLGVVVLAVFVNVALRPSRFVGPDAVTFVALANNMSGPGFWTEPNAFAGDFSGNFWSVGYPLFVGGLLRLGGGSLDVVQAVQVILGSTLAVLAWLLARHLGRRVRLAVLVVVAFSPPVMAMSHSLGYEVLLSWLLVASLALLWGYGGAPPIHNSWRAWIAAFLSGLLVAGAILVQSKSIAVLPVLFWLVWKWGLSSRLAFVGGLAAPVIPWMVRNTLVLGNPSPFSSNGPYNFWLANNPAATTGGYFEGTARPLGDSFVASAMDFLVSQPEAAVALLLRRMVRLLEPIFIYPELDIPPIALICIHYGSAVLALAIVVGFVLYIAGRVWVSHPPLPRVGALAAFVALFYVAHLPFIAEARFMAPVLPVTAVVAVSTLACLRRNTSFRLGGR